MRHRSQEGHPPGLLRAMRARGRGRARRLRRAAACGADCQGGTEPPALSLGAGQDARPQQAGRGQRSVAAGTAPRAREARDSGAPGPARRVAREWRDRSTRGGRGAAQGWRSVTVLVLMEGSDASRQALTLARKFGDPRALRMDAIQPFAPEAIAAALAEAADEVNVSAVLAAGTDRGNEVMARLAARTGLPFASNCIAATPGDPVQVTRQRWGGSLLEEARLHGPRSLITVAPHTVPADSGPAPAEMEIGPPAAADLLVQVSGHVAPANGGVSLATAKVVVSGGRGVGSREGFAIIEELAGLLGAAVGCSRAVTSAGWRPHTDRVGQSKLLQRLLPGLMPAAIFWGCLVLLPTIAIAMIGAVDPHSTLPWLGAQGWYALVVYVFALLVLIGVISAFVNRKFQRPARFQGSHLGEADLILALIAGIVCTLPRS